MARDANKQSVECNDYGHLWTLKTEGAGEVVQRDKCAVNSHEKLIAGCKKALTCASLNSDVRALIVAALAEAGADCVCIQSGHTHCLVPVDQTHADLKAEQERDRERYPQCHNLPEGGVIR